MSSTQPNGKPLSPSKEKPERVTDAADLMTKLNGLGVAESDPSYVVVKFFIDAWVEDGRPRVEKIPFTSVSKVAQLHLSCFLGQKPLLIFKDTDAPKTV